MRTHALVLIGLACAEAVAQKGPSIAMPYDTTSHSYAYSEVIEVGDLAPSALYRNAKAWLTNVSVDTTLIDAVANAKLVDRVALQVSTVFSAGMGVKMPMYQNVTYIVTLEFKEGRYRYSINTFRVGGDGTAAAPGMALETYVKQHESMTAGKKKMIDHEEQFCTALDLEVKKLVVALKAGVRASKKTDDW